MANKIKINVGTPENPVWEEFDANNGDYVNGIMFRVNAEKIEWSDNDGATWNKTGTDTSDANATSETILSGYTAYVNDVKVVGNIPNVGSETRSVSTLNDSTGGKGGGIVAIAEAGGGDMALNVDFVPPKGYYDGVNSKIGLRFWGIKPHNIKAGDRIGWGDGTALVGTFTSDANAAAGDIISGRTAYVNGVKITGNLVERGAYTAASSFAGNSGGTSYVRIPFGAYRTPAGAGVPEITLPGTIVDTANANLDPAYLVSGYSGYDDGVLKGGTLPNRSAENYHMPALEHTVWHNDRVFLKPPRGYYDGGSWVTAPAANFNPSNIRNGVNIMGVVGNLIPRMFAEGQVTSSSYTMNFYAQNRNYYSMYKVEVGGLGFNPSVILIWRNGEGYELNELVLCTSTIDQGFPLTLYNDDDHGNTNILTYLPDSNTHNRFRNWMGGNGADNQNGYFRMPVYRGSTVYNWRAFRY